jgi:hypothetical protein
MGASTSHTYRPSRPVTEITLIFLFYILKYSGGQTQQWFYIQYTPWREAMENNIYLKPSSILPHRVFISEGNTFEYLAEKHTLQ